VPVRATDQTAVRPKPGVTPKSGNTITVPVTAADGTRPSPSSRWQPTSHRRTRFRKAFDAEADSASLRVARTSQQEIEADREDSDGVGESSARERAQPPRPTRAPPRNEHTLASWTRATNATWPSFSSRPTRKAGQKHVTLEEIADGLPGKGGGGERMIGPVGGKVPAWLLDIVERLVGRGLIDSDEADWTYIRAKPDGVTDWPALTLTVAGRRASEHAATVPPPSE
jgi:hypothetical protein